MLHDPLGNFHVGPGTHARFYVIPWEGNDIFVAVLGVESTTLDTALTAGIPVIESLEIVP